VGKRLCPIVDPSAVGTDASAKTRWNFCGFETDDEDGKSFGQHSNVSIVSGFCELPRFCRASNAEHRRESSGTQASRNTRTNLVARLLDSCKVETG